jgi:hypothetical protein
LGETETFKGNRKFPAITGILMLIAGIANVLWLIAALSGILDIKALLRASWIITPLPYVILDIGFGGNTIVASVVAIIFIFGILLSIVGGILTARKKRWGLALAGSIGALICFPFLGITVLILIVVSKNLFVHQ